MSPQRYPRNSTDAFPKTTEYACSIQRFDKPKDHTDTWVGVACILAAIATAVILYIY